MCALWTSLFKLDNCDSVENKLLSLKCNGRKAVRVIFVFKEQLAVFKLIICNERY